MTYDYDPLESLIEWLEEIREDRRSPSDIACAAEDWAKELRPYLAEYKVREKDEAEAYRRGYRSGQLAAINEMRNIVHMMDERVNKDIDIETVRRETFAATAAVQNT